MMNEYEPDVVSHPGVTILEAMADRGMGFRVLADITGWSFSDLIKVGYGGLGITDELAVGLEVALGIPASFWMERQRLYAEWECRNMLNRRRKGAWA